MPDPDDDEDFSLPNLLVLAVVLGASVSLMSAWLGFLVGIAHG